MKNIILYTLLASMLAFMACEDPISNTGDVNLDFYAVYADEPLVMLEYYPFTNGDNINFGTSDFYISECYITDESGESHELVDIELIDFTNQNKDLNGAETPITITSVDVPNGNYESITFSIGLNSDTNSTKPEEYGPNHPLSLSGHYWAAWNSFIFAKFQGKLTQTDEVDVNWLFHTGKDEVFRTFSYPINLDVRGDKSSLRLVLDHKELFALTSSDYMDIRAKPTNHDPDDLEPLIQITENMEKAINLTID